MAYEENSSSIRSIIPPEIITEILYCLPTKSVVRFRCVSKGWLSLLTDPDFIKTHQKTHQKTLDQNHFILLSDDYILHSLPLLHPHKPLSIQTKFPFQLDPYYSTFYGSCNGLILVSPNDIELDDHMLVVINPTTREFTELPGYHMVPKNQTLYGFGYDCVTDDYKVVTIFPDYYYMAPMNARVYSLTTNTERWVTASCNDHSYHWRMSTKFPGVFVNGYLHWIVREKAGYDVGLPVIVAFSLADECFSEVPSPNGQADIMSMEQCKLVDLGGKLAIVSLIKMEGVVWLMNEYGKKESWTKIVIHGFDKIAMVDPMVSYDNGKILLAGYGRILKYDIEERSFSEPVEICRSQELLVKGVYVESLVSPKLGMTN